MKKSVLVSLFGAVLIMGFQNCSGVNFDSSAGAAGKSALDDGGIPLDPDIPREPSSEIPDDDGDPVKPPTDEEDFATKCRMNLEALAALQNLSAGDLQNLNLSDKGMNANYDQHIVNVTLNRVSGNIRFSKVDLFKANQLRGNISVNALSIASLTNSSGNMVLTANEITDVSASNGNFCIQADQLGAINDQTGNLVIIDSHVKVINNFKGNLFLVNSKVDLMNNRTGNIKQKNSQIISEVN